MFAVLLLTVFSVSLIRVNGVDPVLHCPTFVPEGQSLHCECRFPANAGVPDPSLVLSWPGYSTTNTITVNNVQRQDNGTEYICQMVMSGTTTTATYTLQVAYGPTNSTTSISGPNPFPTDGSQSVTLRCEAIWVNPTPTFSWVGVTCDNGNQANTCMFTPSPQDDGKNVMCRVDNPVSTVPEAKRTAYASFTMGTTEVTTQRTTPTPPTSHQPPPATSTANTFPVTTQDTDPSANNYPWDIQLSCPAGDWLMGTDLTLTCSLLKASYPSKCTTSTNDVLDFRVTHAGLASSVCRVQGFTGCSPFPAGQAGCGCVDDNSTMYTFQYRFTADEIHQGTWDCSVVCFDGFGPALTASTSNCNDRNVTVEEVTTQRTSPAPPTSHQPPPATSTANTFPVTTQDTASPTNTYPWDIHLSCPAGDWRSGTEVTLTCSLLKASYPSKCTEAHANVLHFLVTPAGTSAPTQSCTVTGFTGCNPFPAGQAGCRCVEDNATTYNFQYKFTVDESHTGTWDCSVSCFDAALRDPLVHTPFNCDNRNAVVPSLQSSIPVAAIAGGVIGGVVLLVVIAVIAFVIWKRNRDQRYEKPQPGRNQEINPYTNLHVNIDPLQPSVHYANTEPRPDLSQAEDPAGYMNVENTNTYDTLTSTSADVPTYTQLSAPGTMDTR